MPEPSLTFVDANLLVYAHDPSEARKQPIAQALLEALWQDRERVLSASAL